MMKTIGSAVAAGVILASLLTGCGSGDSADVQKCVDQVKQTLQEAGSTRDLTQGEVDACNDPAQRAFILGDS
jgi:hypothetical protein